MSPVFTTIVHLSKTPTFSSDHFWPIIKQKYIQMKFQYVSKSIEDSRHNGQVIHTGKNIINRLSREIVRFGAADVRSEYP
jgi:hypothetical protein